MFDVSDEKIKEKDQDGLVVVKCYGMEFVKRCSQKMAYAVLKEIMPKDKEKP